MKRRSISPVARALRDYRQRLACRRPILRWREGDTVNLRVDNALPALVFGHSTSIHWHGILLPANMDGVPGMSFNGIAPRRDLSVPFQAGPVRHLLVPQPFRCSRNRPACTVPLIIDPAEPEPFAYDRDYVVLLSDWTDLNPGRPVRAAEENACDHDNYCQAHGRRFHPRRAATMVWPPRSNDRGMWGRMRMTPTDLSDVNANTYTYLMNGTTSAGQLDRAVPSGEKMPLRFINGSAMTYFDVRIPGLKMTVVAADGQYVHPVAVDEFRIAVAETYRRNRRTRGPGRLHDFRAGHGPHRLRQRHLGGARRSARASARASIRVRS